MNRVTVNGKTYHVPSGSISVVNDKVYVDGKLITEECEAKKIKIVIEGNVTGSIKLESGEITVNGDCHDVHNVNGDIKITGDVSGDVSTTNGDVSCRGICGNANTVNGDIRGKGIKTTDVSRLKYGLVDKLIDKILG